jgi:hypothetical protein
MFLIMTKSRERDRVWRTGIGIGIKVIDHGSQDAGYGIREAT